MKPWSPAVLAVAGLIGVVAALLLWRSRRGLELRTRVLEVLAQAAGRGLPLTPLVACAVREVGGRGRVSLARMHARLEQGAPLSAACAAARIFPRHVVGAIRAAEGSAALGGALAAAARDGARSLAHRHRVLLTAAYPLLLGLVLAFLVVPLHERVFDRLFEEPTRLASLAALGARGVLALALAAAFAWLLLRRTCLLLGPRLLASERLLRALSPHVQAGAPLPAALRAAAPASGNAAMAAGARDAAAELEAGLPLKDAVDCLPLPRFVRRRLAFAEPEPAVLAALAEDCGRRHGERLDRVLRWALPLALLALGLLVALSFATLLERMNAWREVILW